MDLMTLKEAIALSPEESNSLYAKHVNPWLLKIYKMLGVNEIDIKSAKGTEIYLRDGRTILDFSSAIGILALGHNHPMIIDAEKVCHDNNLIDALKVAPHKLQAVLSYNLSRLFPDPLSLSILGISGAEVVECSMKLCERVQGPSKNKYITTKGSFHGKTRNAVILSESGEFSDGTLLGLPEGSVIEVPYGDTGAVEQVINEQRQGMKKNRIIAMILEPIQGQGIVVPPKGYLTEIVKLCHDNDILVIFDEIKVGMCRTGTFWAFEIEKVVPDIVTISKALGGGKRAISAMITSEKLFNKAYGSINECALQTTTFGGLGESCAVAIETLNVMIDQNIANAAREKGDYLKSKLLKVKEKYPTLISEIRGRGLLLGIKFDFRNYFLKNIVDTSKVPIFRTLDSICIASITRELYRKYNIIIHFSASDPDILHIAPPLIVENKSLDQFVDSLDDLISNGLLKVLVEFVKGNVKSLCK